MLFLSGERLCNFERILSALKLELLDPENKLNPFDILIGIKKKKEEKEKKKIELKIEIFIQVTENRMWNTASA